jgi:isopropylmalate/homocitrate/citramalate synthase
MRKSWRSPASRRDGRRHHRGGLSHRLEGDFAAVSEIAKRAKNSTICGLARANFKDIDRCWEAVKHAKSPRIHTFIGTSPLHRAIPNLDMDQMAERIHETVTHASNLCDNVQWSPMDATRTEHDYLCRVVEIAIKAGCDHDQHPRHRRLHRARWKVAKI